MFELSFSTIVNLAHYDSAIPLIMFELFSCYLLEGGIVVRSHVGSADDKFILGGVINMCKFDANELSLVVLTDNMEILLCIFGGQQVDDDEFTADFYVLCFPKSSGNKTNENDTLRGDMNKLCGGHSWEGSSGQLHMHYDLECSILVLYTFNSFIAYDIQYTANSNSEPSRFVFKSRIIEEYSFSVSISNVGIWGDRRNCQLIISSDSLLLDIYTIFFCVEEDPVVNRSQIKSRSKAQISAMSEISCPIFLADNQPAYFICATGDSLGVIQLWQLKAGNSALRLIATNATAADENKITCIKLTAMDVDNVATDAKQRQMNLIVLIGDALGSIYFCQFSIKNQSLFKLKKFSASYTVGCIDYLSYYHRTDGSMRIRAYSSHSRVAVQFSFHDSVSAAMQINVDPVHYSGNRIVIEVATVAPKHNFLVSAGPSTSIQVHAIESNEVICIIDTKSASITSLAVFEYLVRREELRQTNDVIIIASGHKDGTLQLHTLSRILNDRAETIASDAGSLHTRTKSVNSTSNDIPTTTDQMETKIDAIDANSYSSSVQAIPLFDIIDDEESVPSEQIPSSRSVSTYASSLIQSHGINIDNLDYKDVHDNERDSVIGTELDEGVDSSLISLEESAPLGNLYCKTSIDDRSLSSTEVLIAVSAATTAFGFTEPNTEEHYSFRLRSVKHEMLLILPITRVVFSRNGSYAALIGANRTIAIFDVKKMEIVAKSISNESLISVSEFLEGTERDEFTELDGDIKDSLLLSVHTASTIKVIDALSGEIYQEFPQSTNGDSACCVVLERLDSINSSTASPQSGPLRSFDVVIVSNDSSFLMCSSNSNSAMRFSPLMSQHAQFLVSSLDSIVQGISGFNHAQSPIVAIWTLRCVCLMRLAQEKGKATEVIRLAEYFIDTNKVRIVYAQSLNTDSSARSHRVIVVLSDGYAAVINM